jgi:putative hydrolase of the HAD superfamily
VTIQHVLLDADGVLQELPGGWYAALEPWLGERSREFFHETWKEELPMLAGQGDYLPTLAATLRAYGVTDPVEDIYRAVWQRIEVVETSVELVHALRAAGYGVHLGTNQEHRRAAHMRTALGYDDLFDVSCYSCELGVAKPEAGFFHEAVRRIGVEPASVLFVDDVARNVEGARAAGLAAEQWHFGQGLDVLWGLMAGHGVTATALSA